MQNVPFQSTFTGVNRERFKDEFVRLLSRQPYSHVLSLAWNLGRSNSKGSRRLRAAEARSDIGKLLGRIDRRLYGTDFHRSTERTRAVFFLERGAGNLHAHGLLHVPASRLLALHRLFPGVRGGLWNDLVPSGSYKLEMIDDRHTTIAYIVKEQHLDADDHTVVWWDEFLSEAAKAEIKKKYEKEIDSRILAMRN